MPLSFRESTHNILILKGSARQNAIFLFNGIFDLAFQKCVFFSENLMNVVQTLI